MSKIVLVLILAASQVLWAQITNSYNTSRHQIAMLTAITHQCGILYRVSQVSQKTQTVQTDSGARQVKFTTALRGTIGADSSTLNEYKILVQSTFHDSFDQRTNQWGYFSVENVQCDRAQ